MANCTHTEAIPVACSTMAPQTWAVCVMVSIGLWGVIIVSVMMLWRLISQ